MSEESKLSLIGQILIALGKIDERQLGEALKVQAELPEDQKKPLGQILLELDLIDPNDIIEAIRVQMQMRAEEESEES